MKKQISSPSLCPRELQLGGLYLAAEFLLIPSLIFSLGSLFGGFSEVFSNFLYYLCNAVCCGLIFRKLLRRSLEQAGAAPGRFLLCSGATFGGFLLCLQVGNRLLARFAPEFSNVNDAAVLALIDQSPLLMLLGTVILVPVSEECLFRGLLFLPFVQKHRTLGYALSAAAFSAIHVIGYAGSVSPATLMLCFVQYLPAGLLLCWAFRASGSLLAPMIVHSAVNAYSFFSLR